MSRTDEENLRDAQDHLRVLRSHLRRGDLADQTVADAVSLRLASAIDALASVRTEVRERIAGGDWRAMWATRNRIAHGYAYVDLAIIRATVERDLPRIEEAIRAEIADGRTPTA